MTEREKPIVEIRALNYSWVELDKFARPGAIEHVVVKQYRVEVRREGETEWEEIPVIEVPGRPPEPGIGITSPLNPNQ